MCVCRQSDASERIVSEKVSQKHVAANSGQRPKVKPIRQRPEPTLQSLLRREHISLALTLPCGCVKDR